MDTEATLDAVENTLHVVEGTVDHIEKHKNLVVPVGIVSALVGAGVGGYFAYRFGVKRTTAKYEEILRDEVAEAKEFYARRYKTDEFATPEGAAKVLITADTSDIDEKLERAAHALISYDQVTPADDRPEEVVVVERENRPDPRPDVNEVVQNIFSQNASKDGEWDYDAEEELRAEARRLDLPYVIHHDEFLQNEDGYDQLTVTYFGGDDVLVDDRDEPIDRVEHTIGESSLTKFGHGSKQNNIVYVRNEKLETDFEVILNQGSYTEQVLGFKHSGNIYDRRGRRAGGRRFRDED